MGRAKADLPFLIGHSAGTFHVTAAGRDALATAGMRGYPRGYNVPPASNLAASLLQLASENRGRVPKTFTDAVLKATGVMKVIRAPDDFGVVVKVMKAGNPEKWPGPEAMLRKKAIRQALENPKQLTKAQLAKLRYVPGVKNTSGPISSDPMCSVEGCGAQIGPGGRRGGERPKCARCYQRERRQLPEEGRKEATAARDVSITFQTTPEIAAWINDMAKRECSTPSTLVHRLIETFTKSNAPVARAMGRFWNKVAEARAGGAIR